MSKTYNLTVEVSQDPASDLPWFAKWEDDGAFFYSFRRGRVTIIVHK